MSHKRYAIGLACLVPALALVLVLFSMHAMAAPPPPVSDLLPSGRPANSVCFYRDHTLECVSRPGLRLIGSLQDAARALIQALVDGPSAAERALGFRSALPQGAQLADVSVTGDAVTVKLVLPEAFLYGGLDALVSDEIHEQIIKALDPLEQLVTFHVLALDPRDPSGAFKPVSYFLFELPPTRKSEAARSASPLTLTTGALAGKAVYLSAGHGWYWDGYWNEWRTQRYALGSNNIVEDFNNAEVVNQYLVQYLRNAGADVWPVREQDMNTQEMIVAHNQPEYSDSGPWLNSSFTGYQGQPYRYAIVSSTATATATWTFTPTASGRYAVYAWYYPSNNRAPDAHYRVAHDGGVTPVQVDQRVHGFTWRYIGTFPFAANVPGRVMLTNQSATTNTVVIADAMRVGGGMGTESGGGPPPSPGPSGKPRWEEASRYWAKYQGAPPDIYNPSYCAAVSGYLPGQKDFCDDVTVRPRYAEWEHPSDEDAVYVSWHTNGGGGRGTESYIYDGGATPGSEQLRAAVQSALVHDIRAGWESGWADRGLRQANFGEVRPLQTMPGTLVEIAFHDEPNDANALKDPRFAQLTARAMYKGILRYFADKDGQTPVVLPEPPRNLYVWNSGGVGQVTVSWKPSPTDTEGLLGDAATGYRVYTSDDGSGWGDGVAVTGTSFTLAGLAPGQLIFVRVSATNAGGESFPTPVGAARVADAGLAHVLVVNGYERLDRFMDVVRCDTPEANCPNSRIRPAQMNDQSYVIQHATAIVLPFDSGVRGAVDGGDITLANYSVVDWLAGQEQTPAPIPNGTTEVALTPAEQSALAAFVNSGHGLFMSGAEVAFDLNQTGGLSFLAGTLRAQYAADDAGSFAVSPAASGIFSGLLPFSFDDGSHGTYAVNYPDVLTPTNGSQAGLNYVGGTGGVAALEYMSGCRRLVYLGFPFETIYPLQTRQAVMARVMSYLGACLSQPPSAVILSPESQFYNRVPPINGIASGSPPVDHVDVAVIQITVSHTPTLLFLNGTSWVTSETWLSATGNVTWAYTPSVAFDDARYAVWARAWNSAGVSSTQTAVVSFTLDTVAPTAPVPITPTGGITLPVMSATLVFSPSQDANGVAGYTVKVDGNLYTTTATSFPASGLTAGIHTWAVRAFDAASNVSLWMTDTFATQFVLLYLPVVMRDASSSSPPVTNCQELVTNGGFETQGYWYSLNVPEAQPSYVASPVHGGGGSLLMGYTTTVGAPASLIYSSIQQTITVPLTATQTTMTFWRYPVSGDTQGDLQYFAVGPAPTNVAIIWQMKSNERAWTPTTLDLSAYTGTLTVRFGVYNDGKNGVSAVYLDDVSVRSCGP